MAEFGNQAVYNCRNCRNPIALRKDLLSKKYCAKSGQAYMFSHAMNIIVGHKEDRKLLTGEFSVAEVYCSECRQVLGWKYVKAHEELQRFKEGKFIIELAKIAKLY